MRCSMTITSFDVAFTTTRPGDLVGDPYSVAFARADRTEPILHHGGDQHPLLYQDVEPLGKLPAEADVEAMDDADELAVVDVAGWPALIAGRYK